ncbi:hypothetical protein [Novosphingobium naphthalenivorans]|uniref:hypothetical protein n=1 Tax=Novosphingobium naphthalenivorans TaxID=273168 RepID=UPI000B22CD6E|nr:hypothetical protein [Novosphingobium naphthalenivorans]
MDAFKGWIGTDSTTLDIKRLARAAASAMKPSEYIPITIELAATLRVERERTGYSPVSLLRRFASSCPQHLTHTTIGGWMNLKTKTGNAEHIFWVLNRYADLPDIGAR